MGVGEPPVTSQSLPSAPAPGSVGIWAFDVEQPANRLIRAPGTPGNTGPSQGWRTPSTKARAFQKSPFKYFN